VPNNDVGNFTAWRPSFGGHRQSVMAFGRLATLIYALTCQSSVASGSFHRAWLTVCPPLSGPLECRDAK